MRRTLMLGILLSFVLCSISLADAFQVCWRLQDGAGNPLLDFMRCSATFDPTTNPVIFPLNCSQEADPLYHAVSSGSVTQNVDGDLTKYRMGLSMTHDKPGFFGNNRVCAFTAILIANVPSDDPTFLDGTWSQQCAGGPGAPFNVSGRIDFVVCPATLTPLDQMQHDVAHQQETVENHPLNIFTNALADAPAMQSQEDVMMQQMNAFGELRAAGLGNFVTLEK
jgi:hypothetical protein